MDPKQLKKLAAACRAAGIKHFKCNDYEFTLSDELPVPARKGNKVDHGVTDHVETESLTETQLLFYSVHEENEEATQ